MMQVTTKSAIVFTVCALADLDYVQAEKDKYPAPFVKNPWEFSKNAETMQEQTYKSLMLPAGPGQKLDAGHENHPPVRVFGGTHTRWNSGSSKLETLLPDPKFKWGAFNARNAFSWLWQGKQTSHDRGLYELELQFLVDTVLTNDSVQKSFRVMQAQLKQYITVELRKPTSEVRRLFDESCKSQNFEALGVSKREVGDFSRVKTSGPGPRFQYTDGVFTIEVDTSKTTADASFTTVELRGSSITLANFGNDWRTDEVANQIHSTSDDPPRVVNLKNGHPCSATDLRALKLMRYDFDFPAFHPEVHIEDHLIPHNTESNPAQIVAYKLQNGQFTDVSGDNFENDCFQGEGGCTQLKYVEPKQHAAVIKALSNKTIAYVASAQDPHERLLEFVADGVFPPQHPFTAIWNKLQQQVIEHGHFDVAEFAQNMEVEVAIENGNFKNITDNVFGGDTLYLKPAGLRKVPITQFQQIIDNVHGGNTLVIAPDVAPGNSFTTAHASMTIKKYQLTAGNQWQEVATFADLEDACGDPPPPPHGGGVGGPPPPPPPLTKCKAVEIGFDGTPPFSDLPGVYESMIIAKVQLSADPEAWHSVSSFNELKATCGPGADSTKCKAVKIAPALKHVVAEHFRTVQGVLPKDYKHIPLAMGDQNPITSIVGGFVHEPDSSGGLVRRRVTHLADFFKFCIDSISQQLLRLVQLQAQLRLDDFEDNAWSHEVPITQSSQITDNVRNGNTLFVKDVPGDPFKNLHASMTIKRYQLIDDNTWHDVASFADLHANCNLGAVTTCTAVKIGFCSVDVADAAVDLSLRDFRGRTVTHVNNVAVSSKADLTAYCNTAANCGPNTKLRFANVAFDNYAPRFSDHPQVTVELADEFDANDFADGPLQVNGGPQDANLDSFKQKKVTHVDGHEVSDKTQLVSHCNPATNCPKGTKLTILDQDEVGASVSLIVTKKIVMPYSYWWKVAKLMRYGTHRYRPTGRRFFVNNRRIWGKDGLTAPFAKSYDFPECRDSLTKAQRDKLKDKHNELEKVASFWQTIGGGIQKSLTDVNKQRRAVAISNYFMAWVDQTYIAPAKLEDLHINIIETAQEGHDVKRDASNMATEVQVDIQFDRTINEDVWPTFVSAILQIYNFQKFEER